MEKFLTTRQVAAMLKVNESTVRRWRATKIFMEDLQDHYGVYWYSIERVEQLAQVYKPTKRRTIYDTTTPPKSQISDSEVLKFIDESTFDDIKSQTATLAERFLTHSKDGNYICPFCGNGAGEDGTGIKFNGETAHCFVCNRGFNIIQAVQELYHCDFKEAVKLCANEIHIDLKHSKKKSITRKKLTPDEELEKKRRELLTPPPDDENPKDLTPYYDACNKELFNYQKAVNYLKSRNLFDELLINTYKLGYDPTINCIIIPHTQTYCTRRQITDIKADRFVHNLSDVKTKLFNADCVNNSEVIFITEGAIDALSIIKVGGSAIAIAGAAQLSNRKRLYQLIKPLKNKPVLVILFDNDDSGNDQADEMLKELEILGFFGIKMNLPTQFNDSNDMLIRDEMTLKDFINYNICRVQAQKLIKAAHQIDPLKIPEEILRELIYLHNSDAGNAERLIKCYGKTHLLYSEDQTRWLNFDGVKWNIAADSSNSSVINLMLSVSKQLQAFIKSEIIKTKPKISEVLKEENATENPEEDQALENILKAVKSIENKKKYSPAIDTAKGFPAIRILSKRLNYDPFLINCLNGMIDLMTGKLYPHDPTKLFSLCAGVEYIPGYRSEIVDNFLHSILPNEEILTALLIYLGYCLTGDVRHDKALFIHGNGRNGKGSLLNALMLLFGDYATPMKNKIIMQSRSLDNGENATPGLAKLQYKRLAVIDELSDKYLDEALFKQLTGGDPIQARPMYGNPFIVIPYFKLILSGNVLPRIKDANDLAIKERLLVIKFQQTFTGANQDPTLRDKLKTPEALSGLLNILVESCLEWQKLGKLYEPAAVNDFKREYLDENDLIGEFIFENCTKGEGLEVRCKDFCEAFKDSSAEAARLSDKAIIKMVEKIDGITKIKKNNGRIFEGIKLNENVN